jgi:hypothetical protein
MIGTRSITVEGKKVELRFDWGAVEDFCEAEDVSFQEFDKAVGSPKKLRALIYHMAQSAGSDVTFEDLRKMSFSQMGIVSELISEAMSDDKKKPKKK